MIELVSIGKTFKDGHKALHGVSFHINKGEFVFLVGPSGSGKSTIIKLIMKELEPTKGKLLVNGKNITKYKRKDIPHLRRGMGVVFQDFRLLPDKTVYENIAFAMEVIEASAREIRKQVPIALSMVGLSKKSNLYPRQLSGGEQQRVSLARAMVNGPSLLIADEPTGNLDPEMSYEIVNVLNEFNQRGTTVLMATHDHEIVNKMKKRVIAIEEGELTRDEKRGGYYNEG